MAHDILHNCPVCQKPLHVTRLHCPACNTTIEGDFQAERLLSLSAEQRNFVFSFLRNRGNIREMEKELGISASAIGMYEQSRREPSAQMLVQLAKKFGVSVDYLLTGREPQHLQQLEQMLQHRIAEADLRLSQRKERPFSRDELAVLFAALLLHE